MTQFVYVLEEAPEDPEVVGGKAAGLSRLSRGGARVPPGFVVVVDALSTFLRENGLEQKAQEAASEHVMLQALRAASWPEALRRAIEGAFNSLVVLTEGAPVAVRSSGSAEDGAGASFAGQHLTLLNVRGRDDVLDAVLQCWASRHRAEVQEYRRLHAVEDALPGMAVIVQTLVPAEASGVAFSVDPASGNDTLVLIECAWGLGEGVVGGLVTPDHFAVRKADREIVRRDVASKLMRVSANGEGGVHQERLPDDRAAQPALRDDQVIELAMLAMRIEEEAGSPQDIEWALADGEFFILQSRPVTAVAQVPPDEGWVSEFDSATDPETIWTSANVQEVLPGQLSPFTNSLNLDLVERYGMEPLERVGIKLRNEDPFFACFYGRPFLNVTMMLDVVDQTPFGSRDALMDQYLSQTRVSAQEFDLAQVPRRPWLRKLLGYLTVLPRMLRYRLRMPKDIHEAELIVEAFEREDAGRPYAERSDDDLVRTIEEGLERGSHVGITHVSGGGITGSSFELLRHCTERWLDDSGGSLQATLCTGLAGLESAQPAFELWDLSRLVLASEELREAFEPSQGAEIVRRIDALPRDHTASFRRALAAFMEHHGHRSVMEGEVAAKAWEEDPPTVHAMIRNYLHADPASSPQRIEERQRREREQATAGALRRLSWWKRPIFRYALREAHRWVVMREHTKSLLVRTLDRGRHLSRELARRLVERGLLADVWDLYALTWSEVKALLRGDLGKEEAAAKIERRKREDVRNRTVVLPEMFRGRPRPLRPDELALPDGHVLNGIPVSPGRVTGKARVIMDPRMDAVIHPGEVLVAPVTDAGWTPLFVAAAAVVVDVGGTLSHGSTVAREYGLPAVVNVKHGTRMIRTGQTITVDGTLGVVVLDSD